MLGVSGFKDLSRNYYYETRASETLNLTAAICGHLPDILNRSLPRKFQMNRYGNICYIRLQKKTGGLPV
jgi:hypothetical protein